jgi:hypothetical protein
MSHKVLRLKKSALALCSVLQAYLNTSPNSVPTEAHPYTTYSSTRYIMELLGDGPSI